MARPGEARQGEEHMKHEAAIESILVFGEFEKQLLQDGDICPYESLKGVIDKDPQGDGYGYVYTARKRFQREKECVLEVIPKVGIKRLNSRGTINWGVRGMKHVGRSARRVMGGLATLVPIEKQKALTKVEQNSFLTLFSQAGIINHMMKPSATKRIAAATESASRILPASETLALFSGKTDKVDKVQ